MVSIKDFRVQFGFCSGVKLMKKKCICSNACSNLGILRKFFSSKKEAAC